MSPERINLNVLIQRAHTWAEVLAMQTRQNIIAQQGTGYYEVSRGIGSEKIKHKNKHRRKSVEKKKQLLSTEFSDIARDIFHTYKIC